MISVTPTRLPLVRELFEAASEVEDRQALLDRECGADADLRAAVEELLAADSQSQPVLDRALELPATGAIPGVVLEDGSVIGRYRILREIGSGGMGAVYLAELETGPAGPRYAVKLVRGPWPELARRLEQETGILGRLEHPNIARLLDAGITAEGLPYLVMEYVEGEPLHSFSVRQGLSPAARVRLFRQVCAAVRYLHQNLVVHRDLKPANILVTAEGAVKVVDFGIAKLLDPVAATPQPGMTLGPMTPEYASPEQIQGGPPSTLTDVYTLGVVLYELLADAKPFAGAALDVLKRVCHDEALKPSSACQTPARAAIRGDLDTIVAKAMRKEPDRRYSSVEQLDEDLRRYLEGLPILARADSLLYRARKFSARNRTLVTAAVLVAAALTVGTVTTWMQSRVAQRERQYAEAQAREAERERTSAQQSEAEARRLQSEAERRLAELQKLARGTVRAFGARVEGSSPAAETLFAESARDSILALNREGIVEPGLAQLLDTASAQLRGKETDRSWETPAGWYASATTPNDYYVGVDRRTAYQGKPSLLLRATAPNPAGGVSVFQRFPAYSYKGKRIRFSAVLRTEKVERSSSISLHAVVAQTFSGDARSANGTSPWKEYVLVVDVPDTADYVQFGVGLSGPGAIWASSFDFREVSAAVPLMEPHAPRNLNFSARPSSEK